MSAVERPRLRGVSVCLMVTVLCEKKKLVLLLTSRSDANSLHTDENGSPWIERDEGRIRLKVIT